MRLKRGKVLWIDPTYGDRLDLYLLHSIHEALDKGFAGGEAFFWLLEPADGNKVIGDLMRFVVNGLHLRGRFAKKDVVTRLRIVAVGDYYTTVVVMVSGIVDVKKARDFIDFASLTTGVTIGFLKLNLSRWFSVEIVGRVKFPSSHEGLLLLSNADVLDGVARR